MGEPVKPSPPSEQRVTPEFAAQAIAELEVAKREAGNGELVGSVSVQSAARLIPEVDAATAARLDRTVEAIHGKREEPYDDPMFIAVNADEDRRTASSARLAIPEGWKLVPAELTEEMRIAGYLYKDKLGARAAYRALLIAAPQPKQPDATEPEAPAGNSADPRQADVAADAAPSSAAPAEGVASIPPHCIRRLEWCMERLALGDQVNRHLLYDEIKAVVERLRTTSATARTAEKPEMLDDGFGNQWELCRADCALQIVRPGKVQCEADDCPHRTDNPSYYP